MKQRLFSLTDLTWGFNEWMRRYTENPESFAVEWQTVMTFLDEDTGDNNVNRYGQEQAAYIASLINE